MNVRMIVRRLTLAGLASALAVPLLATPAGAASCSFNASERTVTITHVDDPSTEETLSIARDAAGAILFGVPLPTTQCGAATVSNTDRIIVSGSDGNVRVTISLAFGPFAPGATPEGAAQSEIEFSMNLGAGAEDLLSINGAPQADTITLGAGTTPVQSARQMAVNTDADADITFLQVENVLVSGSEGSDRLSGQGGNGTGAPYPTKLFLFGGPSIDTIVGGAEGDNLSGDSGNDTMDGAAGDDSLIGGQNADTLIGGPGNDFLTGVFGDDIFIPGPGDDTALGTDSGRDTVSYASAAGPVVVNLGGGAASGEGADILGGPIDNVIGSSFGDTISGNDGRNNLQGRGGNDLLQGAPENDSLLPGAGADDVRGGAGIDSVAYLDSTVGMDVDLSAGTATARNGSTANNDVIASNVESATGSPLSDELTGTDGPNVLSGFDGDDDLFGLAGDDVLDGGNGNDDLDGGPGTDICGQAAGTGTLTSCETVGTSDLKPGDATVRVGEPITYTVTWTHPQRWRRLDTVELRVRNGTEVLAWVRWNQEGNTFQLFRRDGFGPERPGGSGGTLSSPHALLHLGGSDAVALNTQTIAVTMRLSFLRSAIGNHVVEVNAEDDRGSRQGWEAAGTLRVTGA